MLPAIPFDQHFMDTTIRLCTAKSLGPNARAYQALKIKDILSGPYAKLKGVFSQIRVHRIDMYVTPSAACSERGFHLIHLGPKNGFTYTKVLPFTVASSWPGSKVGRIFESLRSSWYPTGPVEKQWFNTDSTTVLMDYFYISTYQNSTDDIALPKYTLQLAVDFHITLRGISKLSLGGGIECGLIDEDDLAI